MNYGKTFLCGSLTAIPELKQTSSGMEYSQFSIAVNRKYKEKEEVSFFELTAWGKTAKALSSFTNKGQNLFFECEPRQETWTSKEGQNHSKVVFSVLKFEFTGPKVDTETPPGFPNKPTPPTPPGFPNKPTPPTPPPMPVSDFSASGEAEDNIPFMRLNQWGGM
jgi:single-strand DNA-binding protein